MRRLNILTIIAAAAALISSVSCGDAVYTVSGNGNDLTALLRSEGFRVKEKSSLDKILKAAPEGAAVIVSGPNYPDAPATVSAGQLERIKAKRLRVFADFYALEDDKPEMQLVEYERVVVTSAETGLEKMDLLSINRGWFYKSSFGDGDALMVLARVAGFDKAEFGLTDTEAFPLVRKIADGVFISTSPLVNFEKIRFMPEAKWKVFWETVFSELMGKKITFGSWPTAVAPAYGKDAVLPATARLDAISKGVEWYFNGHFLVHPSWKEELFEKYQGDGGNPVGPGLPDDIPDGDGTEGILEGHCSAIYADGKQSYRFWLRDDVQGETSMSFALAGKMFDDPHLTEIGQNLADFAFKTFRDGPRNDPDSPTYGLLGWGITPEHKDIYYSDDNARAILGILMVASLTGEHRWDRMLMEAIDGNFNTTGRNGFRGPRLIDSDIQKNGLAFYQNRDLVNPHPHYESWIWPCYIWAYAKTGDKKYYDLAERAIRLTMEAYPDGWRWTNGIQQERARMVLPLAWLYRVAPTEEHKAWIDTIVDELVRNQVECGAIREELGDPSKGNYGTQKRNSDYGRSEAPLIFRNGDPVADMLYTCNFAFFGLNEAACATGDPKIAEAAARLADFLIRIQARSEMYKSLDGAWYRAFNYADWNYWASNADAGWGAQGTLTGWTQSWIVSTLALMEMGTSAWDILNQSNANPE